MKTGEKPDMGDPGAVLEAPAAPRPAGSQEPGASAERIRIVLLEDSEPDVELIHEALLDSGLNISIVSVDTREDFETELRRQPPNIILSDYWLGSFDGNAALGIAKQVAPNIPFIFVTGGLGEEVVIEMLKKGATDYVLKTRLARLAPAVRRA